MGRCFYSRGKALGARRSTSERGQRRVRAAKFVWLAAEDDVDGGKRPQRRFPAASLAGVQPVTTPKVSYRPCPFSPCWAYFLCSE